MDTVSRLLGFTGNQPLKAHGNNAKQNTDIEDVERSDDAESEAMAQVGRIKTSERSKTTLLKKSDEPHKPQQRNNEPSLAQRHQQLGKREVTEAKRLNTELTETKKLNIELTETKKRNIELTESLQNISKDLPMAQERYNSLLREHKARLDGVEELALARKTANDLREALRRSEANSRTHQKETAILKAALEDQKVDLDRMMGLKVAAEHKSEQARSEFETVRRQLRLCKDDLFRLQPMAQLPDTEIVKDFESICQDIIGWIDVEVSAFEKSYPSAVPSQIFSGGCNPDAIHLLEHFPTFGEYFVRYVVHYCLYNAMFSRSVYLLGLPKEVKKCLQAAEHRMATLEPPRDFETISAWRSETLTAIAATPEFAGAREAEIHNAVVETMYQTIDRYFPVIHLQVQSKQRFLHEVVLPAAKLASKIQSAASIYDFHLPAWEPTRTVTMDDHKIMKMVDVKTRKTIKASSATVQDRERRIGGLVVPLEPSLRRINENQRYTLLRPEVNLIELD